MATQNQNTYEYDHLANAAISEAALHAINTLRDAMGCNLSCISPATRKLLETAIETLSKVEHTAHKLPRKYRVNL